MDAALVSVANLVVTGLLAVLTFAYGKKFSEAKKAEIEAKQAEIAAKQGVIDAKQAEIAAKDALIASLKEFNPSSVRQYTRDIISHLNDAIAFKEQEKESLLKQLEDAKKSSADQDATIEELKRKLKENEQQRDVASSLASSAQTFETLIDHTTPGVMGSGKTAFINYLDKYANAVRKYGPQDSGHVFIQIGPPGVSNGHLLAGEQNDKD